MIWFDITLLRRLIQLTRTSLLHFSKASTLQVVKSMDNWDMFSHAPLHIGQNYFALDSLQTQHISPTRYLSNMLYYFGHSCIIWTLQKETFKLAVLRACARYWETDPPAEPGLHPSLRYGKSFGLNKWFANTAWAAGWYSLAVCHWGVRGGGKTRSMIVPNRGIPSPRNQLGVWTKERKTNKTKHKPSNHICYIH